MTTSVAPPWSELLRTARDAADAAARVHVRWRGRLAGTEVREKGHADFVSRVDLEAQREALAVLRLNHPEHAILAEEDDAGMGASERMPGAGSRFLWVVDPLDGTTNFLHGHPAFCSSVGLLHEGRPMVGAVTAVATGERWWASPGSGAFRNGERIRVSRREELRASLVGTGFPFKRPEALAGYLEQFGRVLPACAGIRRGGSAALDLCFLAQGSLDAFWEAWLSPWDIAGGLAILRAAGGCWSRVDGRPLAVNRPGSVLAAGSPELRTELRERLEGV